MKHLILLATLFIGSMSIAQGMGDVTIYSNTGDKFYVVLNGIRQNDAPETNVKVTGLTNPWYSAKIISANNNFEIEKNIPVKFDTLVTYRIIEKKGKFKLRYFSEASMGTATSVPNQSVVNYHATENPTNTGNTTTSTNVDQNQTITGGGTGMTTTSTTTTMTTTENVGTGTTVNTGNGTEKIDINVNITEGGMGANIDMNVSGTGVPSENVTTTTTGNNSSSTTTTSSTSGTGNGTTYYEETTTTTTSSTTNNGVTTYSEETTTTSSGTPSTFGTSTTTTGTGGNFGTTTTTTGYENDNQIDHGYNNCFTTDAEVNGIALQVENEAFSDDQSRIANSAAQNNCMTSLQIKKIAESFTFSEGQVSFLKLAYNNCTDKSNYSIAVETLTFSTDQDEVNKHINAR